MSRQQTLESARKGRATKSTFVGLSGLAKLAQPGAPAAPPPRVDVSGLSQGPDAHGRTPEVRGNDWIHNAHAQIVRQELYNKALQLGSLGLGTGMAWRGLQGLLGSVRRKTRREEDPILNVKASQQQPPATVYRLTDQDIPNPVPSSSKQPLAYTLGGYGADKWYEVPWGIPLAGAAVLGGVRLGHSGVDWLMRKRRQSELDRATEKQKSRYERAMRKISGKLDRLYDLLDSEEGLRKLACVVREADRRIEAARANVKQAQGSSSRPGTITVSKALGELVPSVDTGELFSVSPGSMGVAAGTLLAAGGLSALWAHDRAREYFKKRQPYALLRKAREDAENERFRRDPHIEVAIGPGPGGKAG